jgi:hypothetical protein
LLDEVRALVHKCTQLESLARPLLCNLRSTLVAHVFARNPTLSVDRLEQFLSLCFLSGQPFVSLRVWLRFLRPMAWRTDAHQALLDEVYASTMIDKLVAFSLPSIMRLFPDAGRWCEQVRVAAGEGDVVSAVLQLLRQSEGQDFLAARDLLSDAERTDMQIEFLTFAAREQWCAVQDTLQALFDAALTGCDENEADEVEDEEFDWYA